MYWTTHLLTSWRAWRQRPCSKNTHTFSIHVWRNSRNSCQWCSASEVAIFHLSVFWFPASKTKWWTSTQMTNEQNTFGNRNFTWDICTPAVCRSVSWASNSSSLPIVTVMQSSNRSSAISQGHCTLAPHICLQTTSLDMVYCCETTKLKKNTKTVTVEKNDQQLTL